MAPLSRHDFLPDGFADEATLDAFLAQPSEALISDLAAVPGDILILGAGGKMGPSLARLAKNAAPGKRVTAIARFSEPGLRDRLEGCGVATVQCDLLDREVVARLPETGNVVFMAARKFGASGDPALTWAMNVLVPALVAERFRNARIVAFSTGNVYPLTAPAAGGARVDTPPLAVGEYAQSCLGRERVFEHFSARHDTPGRLVRLNYAIDLRYGVLHDIASHIRAGRPVDVTMGHVNVIWQGDANSQALRCLAQCTVPTSPINVTGPEISAVRWLAEELGSRLGIAPVFAGAEAETALLSNAGEAARLFGYPVVPLGRMLDWVADWVAHDRPSLNKPTRFEVRDGVF